MNEFESNSVELVIVSTAESFFVQKMLISGTKQPPISHDSDSGDYSEELLPEVILKETGFRYATFPVWAGIPARTNFKLRGSFSSFIIFLPFLRKHHVFSFSNSMFHGHKQLEIKHFQQILIETLLILYSYISNYKVLQSMYQSSECNRLAKHPFVGIHGRATSCNTLSQFSVYFKN